MTLLLIGLALGRRSEPEALNEALLRAASRGRGVEVLSLLDAGAEVNCRDRSGRYGGPPPYEGTPLELAAMAGSPKTVAILLKRGGDPNLTPEVSALMIALRYWNDTKMRRKDYERCALLLMEHGADVSVRAAWHSSSAQYSALEGAVRHGNPVLVRRMLERGADLGLPTVEGKSLLSVAPNEDVARILKQFGAKG